MASEEDRGVRLPVKGRTKASRRVVLVVAALAALALCYWLQRSLFGGSPGGNSPYRVEGLDLTAPVTEARLADLSTSDEAVAVGKRIFAEACARCHHDHGQGAIGPNLTDAYWLRDGSAIGIYEIVYTGSPSRGMQAWGPRYGRSGVMLVTAFVMTLRDTNVEGREPQGKLPPGR